MIVLLILFAIIVGITELYKRYISNDLIALAKYKANGGSLLLGILVMTEYVLCAIIIIKIILKIMGE